MAQTTIEALGREGSFQAYVAEPEGTARAAIIVIQEIFGVNEGIRRKCDAWAKQGYLAIAPDLFWRLQPGVELDADVPEEFQKGIELMSRTDVNAAVRDIEATIKAARAKVNGGKVGLVGYCFGGKLAYLAATRTDVDASVGYYGVQIEAMLNEAHAIGKPLMLHIAKADGFVGPEAQAQIHAGLDGNRHVTLHDYEGADHGFAAEMGKRRKEDVAQLADSRTQAFFAEHLA
jgi:carboxymethylenebutenolidase